MPPQVPDVIKKRKLTTFLGIVTVLTSSCRYVHPCSIVERVKFNSWGLSTEKKRPDIVCEKFEKYGKSNQNFRVARLALRIINQKIDNNTNELETMDKFISRLCLQAAQYNFLRTKQTNSNLSLTRCS